MRNRDCDGSQVPCGHLDRAEAAAAAGDTRAAAQFFALAEMQCREAVALAAAVNRLPEGSLVRLHEIAWRLADDGVEPTNGYGIEFRAAETGGVVSVWLTLGRVGPDTGALIVRLDARDAAS